MYCQNSFFFQAAKAHSFHTAFHHQTKPVDVEGVEARGPYPADQGKAEQTLHEAEVGLTRVQVKDCGNENYPGREECEDHENADKQVGPGALHLKLCQEGSEINVKY